MPFNQSQPASGPNNSEAQAVVGRTDPPSCNTGGTHLSEEEKNPLNSAAKPQKTIIDTVTWSVPETTDGGPYFDLGRRTAELVLKLFPDGTEWTEVQPGTKGFKYQTQLVRGGLVCGWLQYGAHHGRLWLYITGTGLRARRDAGLVDEELALLCGLPGSRLKRVDIALDIFDHKIFNVDKSIKAHKRGQYKLPRAPNNPHQELFQSDTNNPDARFKMARTHYLGKRDANKRLRVYDKGLQLMGTMTPEELQKYRDNGTVRAQADENERLEEWTRVELVYAWDKRRPLTAAMLSDRDEYFAGGYPKLAELLGQADGIRPKYIPLDEDVEEAKLTEACRDSYGGLIFYYRYVRGYDDTTIVNRLIGDKCAARLKIDLERPSGWENE